MAEQDTLIIQHLYESQPKIIGVIKGLTSLLDHIESCNQSDDEDLVQPLQAMKRGLLDMRSLALARLPDNPNHISDAIQSLVDNFEGSWLKYERKFVHDLRNPLGVSLGYSELLCETIEDFMEEPEFAKEPWLPAMLEKVEHFTEQLHHFNESLKHMFTARPQLDGIRSAVSKVDSQPEMPQIPSEIFSKHIEPLGKIITGAELIKPVSMSKDARRRVSILVVDDSKSNREMLASMLSREGNQDVDEADSALNAIDRLKEKDYDLILLDLMMPEISGDMLLGMLKGSSQWRHIPVVVISGATDIDNAIRCIELGAEDYLSKPINRVLLKARIGACLDKKLLMDGIEEQNQRFERLLKRVLPTAVIKRMDQGEEMIADRFESTTIIFSDLVGFTKMSSKMSPSQLIQTLNLIFSAFDEIADRLGVEKIKTIGDAYMAAVGLPTENDNHASIAVQMGLEMINALDHLKQTLKLPLDMRVGVNSGPVAAGIIGQNRFLYDVWGDTVNVASRLEASADSGTVHLSETTRSLLSDHYPIIERGTIELKGKGQMKTYAIKGR